MSLSSPFNGDVKPAPGPREQANQMGYPSGTPTNLETPFEDGVFSYKMAQPDSLSLAVMCKTLDGHHAAKLESPFENDMRPGVDSSGSK